ncbi:unnamed protein product [Diatraea saccharalis]|uniref:Uncharacterized protein n=1 Tax=Diatraea saccharalis TaxID=40085 RepID=A0A9N9N2L1_9NEOP|nr:unnamed protein product [Diatraea saccharalis]
MNLNDVMGNCQTTKRVGKYGLSQATAENIPLVDLTQYPGFNPNLPGSQFINKPIIIANANGVQPDLLPAITNFPGSQFLKRPLIVGNGALPELISATPNFSGPQFINRPLVVANANGAPPELSSTRPMWPQRENCAILPDTPVIPVQTPDVTSYQINSFPAIPTKIPPLSVIQNSFRPLKPIIIPSTSPNLNMSPVLFPMQSYPPLLPFPVTQSYSTARDIDEAEIYTYLRYEDFFDDFPDFNDQFENNIISNYESNVNEVNIQSTIVSPIPEVIDTSNTLVSESLDIQQLANTNVGIEFPIPYNIEINLPVLTNPVSNFMPPQAPPFFPPMPPIIIQGSSRNNFKYLLPIILATLLNNDGNTGCSGSCGNRYIPMPYPIPVSVNNAIINGPETEVSGQLYNAPIIRTDSNNDDLGVLLTVLLLTSRNRGSGNCNCCSCCGGGNIPIPYPIPIPTNNPIIYTYPRCYDGDYGDEEGGSSSSSSAAATGGAGGAGGSASSEPEQNVYVITNSAANALNTIDDKTSAASGSAASSTSSNE